MRVFDSFCKVMTTTGIKTPRSFLTDALTGNFTLYVEHEHEDDDTQPHGYFLQDVLPFVQCGVDAEVMQFLDLAAHPHTRPTGIMFIGANRDGHINLIYEVYPADDGYVMCEGVYDFLDDVPRETPWSNVGIQMAGDSSLGALTAYGLDMGHWLTAMLHHVGTITTTKETS